MKTIYLLVAKPDNPESKVQFLRAFETRDQAEDIAIMMSPVVENYDLSIIETQMEGARPAVQFSPGALPLARP